MVSDCPPPCSGRRCREHGVRLHAVIYFDERHHVLQQVRSNAWVFESKPFAPVPGAAAWPSIITTPSLGAALGDEVVENPVRLAMRDPRRLVVPAAML